MAAKEDFEKASRQKFYARIAAGDYDAESVGHSRFERIPFFRERRLRMLQDWIDEITEGIAELKHHCGRQFSIKQLERPGRQFENKLLKKEAAEENHVVTFDRQGFRGSDFCILRAYG